MESEPKVENTEEYLARGGEITKLPARHTKPRSNKQLAKELERRRKPNRKKKNADRLVQLARDPKRFYVSKEWRKARYSALVRDKGKCNCCGKTSKDGVIIHVDHIQPRYNHPKLALNVDNLQVLCEECNLGKGTVDETDWRQYHK